MHHCTKFHESGHMVLEITFNGFQNGSRLPSWNCGVQFATTLKDYTKIFIIVQNLVGIGEVVLII